MSKILSPLEWVISKYDGFPKNLSPDILKEYAIYVRDITLEVAAQRAQTDSEYDAVRDEAYEFIDREAIIQLKNSEDLKI